MFQDGSAPVFRANASAMQHPTLSEVRIGSTRDALQIFYAVALNTLPMVHRRLDAEERRAITTGNVYVWEERGANSEATGLGIERWTDGMRWSPSRVRDDFLFYHQKEMDPEEAADLPPTRWARTVRPRTSTSEGDEASPPTDAVQRSMQDPMRLIKQTYSVIVSLPYDRPKDIERKWHLTAYFTQATVNELRKIEEVLPVVHVVPDGWFRSARSGKQRQGSKAQRPIQFANSFAADASGLTSMAMQEDQAQMGVEMGVAGPSGSSPSTQFGPGPPYDGQPHQQQAVYVTGQSVPQYAPYRGQEAYDMRPSHQPPQYLQHSQYSPPHISGPYAHAAFPPHPPLPPPPSMPQYNTSSQVRSVGPGLDGVQGRETEYDEARRREAERQQYSQYQQHQDRQQPMHVQSERSITVVAPAAYERAPARPLPPISTPNMSPRRGHPYANALPSRPQRLGSSSGTNRPSEYYEPPSALKTIPVSVSPAFMAKPMASGSGSGDAPRGGESDNAGVAGGGVYRIPHSHSHGTAPHRRSPAQSTASSKATLPHHLPLPPSPPGPTSHFGAGEAEVPVPTLQLNSVSATAFVAGSGNDSASVSPSVSTAVSSAPTIVAPAALPALNHLALPPIVAGEEKDRVLVPLGELQPGNYRRRDPIDDALLRRFNGLRTTPPANMMEE